MFQKISSNISGRLAVWGILCLNFLGVFVYAFIPEMVFKEHIFYFIIELILLLGTYLVMSKSGIDPVKETGIKNRVDWLSFIYVALISVGLLYFGNFFANIVFYSFESFGYMPAQSSLDEISTIAELVISLFTVALLPAISEEFLVRGGILTSLRRSLGNKKAIIISALFFALLHGSVVQTVHQFLMGVACALLLIAGGSIWYCVALHFFNNAFALIITYLQSFIVQDSAQSATNFFEISSILPSAIMAVVGFVCLIFALNAFMRRLERKRGKEFVCERLSFNTLINRAQRIGEIKVERAEFSSTEKLMLGLSFLTTIALIILDLVKGFGV